MMPGCPEPGSNPHAEPTLEAVRAQLQERERELAELRAAQAEFLRAVSHDLRAPLRHITSYGPLVAELLQDAGLQGDGLQEAQSFLATMDQSARRMGRMLDGLLALSHIARAPLQRQPVELGALVAEVQATLAARAQGRAVEWQIAADLPRVLGDATLLRQMLVELLGNALKFTHGRVPACIAVDGERGADGRATLRVQDNGAGFNPAQAAGLFGVFQRLHREAEFEGVGAGLAAVPLPGAMAATPVPRRYRVLAARSACVFNAPDLIAACD